MKIICIGRNYAEHAKELNSPIPDEPVFFLKPDTALIERKAKFFYPSFSKDVHYETELVLHICRRGKNIPEKEAGNYFDGITVGLDFTARDIQNECRTKGLPWEKAKSFDGAAGLGEFMDKSDFRDLKNISFSMNKNDVKIQNGNSSGMLFSFGALISYVSKFITLCPGDLIYTGTPAGVGPVHINDRLECFIGNKKLLEVTVG